MTEVITGFDIRRLPGKPGRKTALLIAPRSATPSIGRSGPSRMGCYAGRLSSTSTATSGLSSSTSWRSARETEFTSIGSMLTSHMQSGRTQSGRFDPVSKQSPAIRINSSCASITPEGFGMISTSGSGQRGSARSVLSCPKTPSARQQLRIMSDLVPDLHRQQSLGNSRIARIRKGTWYPLLKPCHRTSVCPLSITLAPVLLYSKRGQTESPVRRERASNTPRLHHFYPHDIAPSAINARSGPPVDDAIPEGGVRGLWLSDGRARDRVGIEPSSAHGSSCHPDETQSPSRSTQLPLDAEVDNSCPQRG